ncbi:glycosyl hydrolase 115 family protein [Paenibacillus thailandensis]|uniref:Glycosyl hydrolase 115 family protein n=1 Tax=Paenibacillus thailandensis TaxID=393250 RepID=A0ABW5QWC0_9BACL
MGNANVYKLLPDTPISVPERPAKPVRHALDMLARDWQAVFGQAPSFGSESSAAKAVDFSIAIRYAQPQDECPERPEAFVIRFPAAAGDDAAMVIAARDHLGLVYGILHLSRVYLGVDPFWFWADIPILPQSSVSIVATDYISPEAAVRFRGWFVNDEVCLIGWKDGYPPTEEVWMPVFEALLRCGGNMVIPGTDLPRDGIHWKLASEMGLWITHHHAEPLGAEMFLRAYPGKTPSYKEHPELFEKLWRDAIEEQKEQSLVWVLSFRGQGDAPFWQYDPSFVTSESRGEMISRVIRKQYEMVHEAVPEPVCCVALYGEIAELYKEGHIDLPDDVIKVWADNGYGKMVSRRHGNTNLRKPALPDAGDRGKHGLYYHVTFHDLQASNHLTMFPSSSAFVNRELQQAFHAGAQDYWLINCGNIRQHAYLLDFIGKLWLTGQEDVERHLADWIGRLFSGEHDGIARLYRQYAELTIRYGPHEDDRAGDEFYHHPARKIVGRWIQGKRDQSDKRLHWATGDVPFAEQVKWFGRKCEEALPGWEQWVASCRALAGRLEENEKMRLYDQLLFHGELHRSGCRGFIALAKAYEAFDGGSFALSFVYATDAKREYAEGIKLLSRAEHGKWERFYKADWLTNVKSTVYNMDTLLKFIRMHGDSPDFFLWYKEYIMPETEKYIYLENTHRNPLSDDDLADRLREKFKAQGIYR